MSNYLDEAEEDAKNMVEHFNSEILDMLKEKGEASTDHNNDYPNGDAYHHETHVDKEYDLKESADLLDELSDYIETDTGLWEGKEPREAIAAQAAYTYGNAVIAKWQEKIKEINEAWENSDLGNLLSL